MKLGAQVSGRDPSFAHSMANLVQFEDHIARCVQPWDIGSLMTIDHHATVFAVAFAQGGGGGAGGAGGAGAGSPSGAGTSGGGTGHACAVAHCRPVSVFAK